MSVYASISGIGDYVDDEALGQPWIYQGSHVLPADDDPRGGSISLAIIPSHITRDGRDNQPEDGRPWPWLRLSVDTDTDDLTVLLNPAQARHHGAQLTAWADEAAPHPAPDSLRERYVALFRHAPGELRLGDEPPGPIADAVLAVRDEEVEQLRAELTRMQEAGDHHIGAADRARAEVQRDRDQHAAVLAEVLATFVHETHPGYRALQSQHVKLERVEQWRAVLAPTVETPWWQQIAELREQLAEARSWARHGYEIGQRSCTWSDYGVAPAWLTEEWAPHSEPPAEETTTEVARADARYWAEKDDEPTNPAG